MDHQRFTRKSFSISHRFGHDDNHCGQKAARPQPPSMVEPNHPPREHAPHQQTWIRKQTLTTNADSLFGDNTGYAAKSPSQSLNDSPTVGGDLTNGDN